MFEWWKRRQLKKKQLSDWEEHSDRIKRKIHLYDQQSLQLAEHFSLPEQWLIRNNSRKLTDEYFKVINDKDLSKLVELLELHKERLERLTMKKLTYNL